MIQFKKLAFVTEFCLFLLKLRSSEHLNSRAYLSILEIALLIRLFRLIS